MNKAIHDRLDGDRLFTVTPLGVRIDRFTTFVFEIQAYGKSFQIADRYSSIEAWQNSLKLRLGRSVQELKFPAKSLLLSNNSIFVEKRHKELSEFISEFVNHPVFGLGNF